ncbi:MAG TPA: GNAT family N-acetyltransferase [Rhizomicrobium sp.]|jgi:GNAT superfamily N-acetyltransferase|nr:GNAT family N-acetyltransferase [Rhizomicrobium sp.]
MTETFTAGDGKKRVPMTVTFLEMRAKPAALPPPQPKSKFAILRAENPPVHFYRYLYNTIGEPYLWVDRRKLADPALAAIIHDPRTELYVLYMDGNPAGMAELEFRDPEAAQVAYFGLMPDFVGRGLGYYFLYHAVSIAWSRPIAKLLINTCTLDHPRALPLYQRIGFVPYSREDRYIELP